MTSNYLHFSKKLKFSIIQYKTSVWWAKSAPTLIEIGIIYVQKMGRTSSPHVPVRTGVPESRLWTKAMENVNIGMMQHI